MGTDTWKPLVRAQSKAIYIHDGLRKCYRGFLRHVVTDAGQNAVLILTDELLRVALSVGSSSIEIACDRDGRNRNVGPLEQLRLEIAVLRLTLGEAQSPPIVMNHDLD